ncbi:unnamed protein product [Notodromas monacha]|uniref:Methyltransferase-like 26 n=1 Tax=Notodromas monacha TaxID=399045 RepID=A0A7R9BWM2_9CRUS|nr:unnamed protein product [Notodromas monacha]CAG0921955.1 unnamed protein product [Notodromas monacha]
MIKAAAPARNKAPILEVLNVAIGKFFKGNTSLKCLEVASGTGQHVAHFAPLLPQVDWQPSDIDESYLASIRAYKKELNLKNVREPVIVDVTDKPGPNAVGEFLRGCDANSYDMIYNANMMHISPFACSEGLFRCAAFLLKSGGLLITYGPYGFNGTLTPESNVSFNESLKTSNPEWGIRDVDLQLKPLAEMNGLKLNMSFDMPANNKTLIWRKDPVD